MGKLLEAFLSKSLLIKGLRKTMAKNASRERKPPGKTIGFERPSKAAALPGGKESFLLRKKKPFFLLKNLRDALASLTVSEPYRFRKSLGKKCANFLLSIFFHFSGFLFFRLQLPAGSPYQGCPGYEALPGKFLQQFCRQLLAPSDSISSSTNLPQ
ncbi:MAG: hypothetical protein WC634_00795 [archaeon]